MNYAQLLDEVPWSAISMCECGALVANKVFHDAYHDQNDKVNYR